MTNPKHRPKHRQSRNRFKVTTTSGLLVGRPVDGSEWNFGPSIDECGLVFIINDDSECIGTVEVGYFDKHAVRADWTD